MLSSNLLSNFCFSLKQVWIKVQVYAWNKIYALSVSQVGSFVKTRGAILVILWCLQLAKNIRQKTMAPCAVVSNVKNPPKISSHDEIIFRFDLPIGFYNLGWALWNRNSFEFKFDDTRLSSYYKNKIGPINRSGN